LKPLTKLRIVNTVNGKSPKNAAKHTIQEPIKVNAGTKLGIPVKQMKNKPNNAKPVNTTCKR